MPRLDTTSVSELERGSDFSFAARFDVHPQFEVGGADSLELFKLDEEISEEEIDGVVEKLRESGRNYEKTEDGEGEAGDMLKVTYKGTIDTEDEVPPTAERLIAAEDTWVLLSDPEILPGIAEGLAGSKVGDEKTLAVTFAEDFHEPFLANKSGEYAITVHEIHKSVLPELNDEFAGRYGAESVEKFMEMVRERITNDRKQQHMQVWRHQIEQWLVGQASFNMPLVTLRGEADMLLPQIMQQKLQENGEDGEHHGHVHDENCAHGCDHDHDHEHAEAAEDEAKTDGEASEGDDSQQKLIEESRKEAEEAAEFRLKLRIVRDAWAKSESIEATQEEVRQEVFGFMQQNRISPDELEEKYDVERLFGAMSEEVLTKKLVEHLLEKATFVEPPKNEDKEAEVEATA